MSPARSVPAAAAAKAAAAASAAAAAAEAASATTAAARAGPVGAGPSFVSRQGTALEVDAVQSGDGLVGLVLVRHLDEAETAGLTGKLVLDDRRAGNLAKRRESVLKDSALGMLICPAPQESLRLSIRPWRYVR